MQPRTADTVGSDADGRRQVVAPASRPGAAASERHTPLQSILLHLGPGVAIGAFYFLVRGPLLRAGFPPLFALMVAVPLVLVPLELGILLIEGRRRRGRLSLRGVIGYTLRVPWWQVALWSVGVFVVAGAIFTAMGPLDTFLQERVFAWVPPMASGLEGTFDRGRLVVTYLAVALFGMIVGPVVEELYFRGYLLPRMRGRAAPVWHSLLFAAYHVFTPWMIVTRTVGLLPLVYAVRRKNILVGIVAHVLVNSVDVVVGFAAIAAMG